MVLMSYIMDHPPLVVLDRRDPLPLYHQLKRSLVQRIRAGQFPTDRPFPSERELVDQLHVSRMTVRMALQELAREGLLRRERGRGSFVTPPKLSRQADRLIGLSEDEVAVRSPVAIQERSLRLLGLTDSFPTCFAMNPAYVLYRAERVGVLGNQALMHSTVYIRVPAGILLTESNLEEFGSLFILLERMLGLTISHGSRTLEAAEARKRDVHLLGTRPRAPLLLVRTTTFERSGDVVMYSENRYRGDRYQYRVPFIGRRTSPPAEADAEVTERAV